MIVNESKEKIYEIGLEDAQVIEAAPKGIPMDYKDLNALIREVVNLDYKKIILNNVCGQRFIGAALQGDIELTINGIPGNDLGIFMDGPSIMINGNCEDQCGNTMNDGTIIIDGDCGDVVGLSSRGGIILVKNNVGYRVGIHMKEYQNKCPMIIIGGTTGDYLGEYMAGGKIIVLGLEILSDGTVLENQQPICGSNIGAGIHGGTIYLRTREDLDRRLGVGTKCAELSIEEQKEIMTYVSKFCRIFNIPVNTIRNVPFKAIKPISKRPFGGNYCSQSI
jgi:glutamate synthase domain-containing protein 3